jgi:hypothetical protein
MCWHDFRLADRFIGIGTCSAVSGLQRPAMFARALREVEGFQCVLI